MAQFSFITSALTHQISVTDTILQMVLIHVLWSIQLEILSVVSSLVWEEDRAPIIIILLKRIVIMQDDVYVESQWPESSTKKLRCLVNKKFDEIAYLLCCEMLHLLRQYITLYKAHYTVANIYDPRVMLNKVTSHHEKISEHSEQTEYGTWSIFNESFKQILVEGKLIWC
ncbi:hypothetical protein BDA99DRAFT_574253 [Phascolomyces articulosus]|uniref:Uncharacterized protein n=1 Tax=Phascolomyces articulosus TaxID=60185 RepID=A0AAD5K3M3_9FUNG|nr:hypothetical protein BDA99DRAFT_574253 [Phascolomyces articulosus]